MIFDSKFTVRGDFDSNFTQDQIKNEPMFFNSNVDFAYDNGGALTREFIDKLPVDWLVSNPVIDSRVHMLMPGWYPCIPGWHHDDVPRSTPTGQPNYVNPEYRSEHLMGLVNGDICPTLFIKGKIEVSEPDENKIIYEEWSKQIEGGTGLVVPAKSGVYIQFDCDTFHTGDAARGSGWRWFIRLSRNTDRQKNITNEIRRQVQVYMTNPNKGW